MLNRNIIVLFFSQALGYSSISFLILVSSILGAEVGPSQSLATLPMALSVIGTAAAAVPAAMLMKRIGRKRGFLVAYAMALAACAAGFLSAWHRDFFLLCLCTFLIGGFLAFAHQFRFAAIESLENPDDAGPAISFLLLGGVAAAFLGPQVAEWGKDWLARPFAGSFVLLLGIYCVSALIFGAGFRNPRLRASGADDPGPARPLGRIVRQPAFLLALSSAVISYAVMSFIMTATPVSMHHVDGFEFSEARRVIQWHVAAMFLPSLFNVFLFRYAGIKSVMIAGAATYVAMGIVALQGHELIHYTGSLILLGVGWNFLFVAGTALLAQTYRSAERFTVQATNDFVVYTVQGATSLCAGWLLYRIGWDNMILLTLPLSALMLAAAVGTTSGKRNKGKG